MQPVSLWVQRSGGATIVVVQTAEHGKGDDLPGVRRLYLRRHRNTLADALVRAGTCPLGGWQFPAGPVGRDGGSEEVDSGKAGGYPCRIGLS